MKKGFSLIELIFVIVVMGMIASVGSESLVKVTDSFLLQRGKHNSAEKVELALEQISNRLLYRIPESMRTKKLDGTSLPLNQITPTTPAKDDYVGLEWIGYDNSGFASSTPPGWSGFVDLDNSDFLKIRSTGSNFDFEKTIMANETGNFNNGAIIFLDTPNYRNNGADITYNTTCMYQANGCIFPVSISGNTATFTGGDRVAGEMIYSEFYQLASSAFTVMAEPDGNTFDLFLYSNYQPWLGETFLNGQKDLLAKNVSVFRYKEEYNTIRIKLCIDEMVKNKKITTCREKAVIR